MTEPEGILDIGKSTVRSPGSGKKGKKGEERVRTTVWCGQRPRSSVYEASVSMATTQSPMLTLTHRVLVLPGTYSASTLSVRMCFPNGPYLADTESLEVSAFLISVTLLLVFLLAAQPDVIGAQLFISSMFLTERCWKTTHQKGTS